MGFEPVCDLPEQEVGEDMPLKVVDRLKVVEVEKQHHVERNPRRVPLLDRLRKSLQEAGAVGQPGEPVVRRRQAQFLLRLPALIDLGLQVGVRGLQFAILRFRCARQPMFLGERDRQLIRFFRCKRLLQEQEPIRCAAALDHLVPGVIGVGGTHDDLQLVIGPQ